MQPEFARGLEDWLVVKDVRAVDGAKAE